MATIFEHLGLFARWVSGVAGAILGIVGCWQLARKYLEYRHTRQGIERVRAKFQRLGITTTAVIEDFVARLVDKGIVKPAGPDGPARRLTCTAETGKRIAAALIELMSRESVPTGRALLRSSMVLCLSFVEEVLLAIDPVRSAGDVVAPDDGEWVLKRLLGVDHCGEIWLGARKEHEGVAVAISHLRAFRFFTKEPARRKMLAAHLDLNASLTTLAGHPNVVPFHHFAMCDEQVPCMVTEYVPGGSLDDWITANPEQRVPLRKQEIMEGLISALANAHDNGIFHRDLSPRKVLLSDRFEPQQSNKKPRAYDVQAKIAEFGMAAITAGGEPEIIVKQGNGTESFAAASCSCMSQYLPPEADHAIQRAPAQDDLFALGVIWYQLLAEAMERPPYNFAERLADLGIEDRTIAQIGRCLAHPDRRYKDARELEDDLEMTEMVQLPQWPPTPKGLFDVSHLVRDYIGIGAGYEALFGIQQA